MRQETDSKPSKIANEKELANARGPKTSYKQCDYIFMYTPNNGNIVRCSLEAGHTGTHLLPTSIIIPTTTGQTFSISWNSNGTGSS